MSRNTLTAMFTVVFMLVGSVFAFAQGACPDDPSCPWENQYVAYDKFVQYDTILSSSPDRLFTILKCERYFAFNVCHRCCDDKMEVRLSWVNGCDQNGNSDPDPTRGCQWRYDQEFWRQIDNAVAYRFNYLKCNGKSLECDNIPDCKDQVKRQVVSYYKATCWSWVQNHDPIAGQEWVMKPCDASGECKRVYEVCCVKKPGGNTYTYNLVEKSGGDQCTGVSPNGPEEGCFQSCW